MRRPLIFEFLLFKGCHWCWLHFESEELIWSYGVVEVRDRGIQALRGLKLP